MVDDRMSIDEILQFPKREGSLLAEPIPVGHMPPMTFSCDPSADGINPDELLAIPYRCPPDLGNLWGIVRTARLFEDKQYGQWGLEILTPQQAAQATALCRMNREKEFIFGDLVVGEFLGNSDLLVIRCDEPKDDFGEVLIALPIDSRPDWDRPAGSLAAFLEMYARAGGEKYWTRG